MPARGFNITEYSNYYTRDEILMEIPMPMAESHPITSAWLQELRNHGITNHHEDPNYWSSDPAVLISNSKALSFGVGTGYEILSSIIPACSATKHEIIIVTCFWVESSSQEAISSLLRRLSSKAVLQNHKIQVRICLSSISIFQKLFQTSRLNGRTYPPSSWPSLGLPALEELEGLDMVVKSVFVRPFSVMHPKFILVDRKLAFMPSCNVSCVDWFEGCIEMRGDIVGKLFDFWSAFWSRGGASLPSLPLEYGSPSANEDTSLAELSNVLEYNIFSKDILPTTTILLPSPHHANPRFISFQPAPATPLNIFLLQSFKLAKSTLFLITPNITSKPVINALFSALKRGVDVHLVTSSRLMILEQLVTAGTITEFEIWKLRRRYRKLLSMYHRASSTDADPENPMEKPGGLKVGYYHAKRGIQGGSEPVKTHLKLLIVDEEITVLGSGNQDRASWYTSQELGVAFLDACIANDVRKTSDQALEGRVDYIC